MDNRLDAKLEWLASQIVLRRLEVPATLFLEMHRPLNTVFHTLVLGLFPLVSPFVGGNRFHEFEQLLENPESIEILLNKISTRTKERDFEVC